MIFPLLSGGDGKKVKLKEPGRMSQLNLKTLDSIAVGQCWPLYTFGILRMCHKAKAAFLLHTKQQRFIVVTKTSWPGGKHIVYSLCIRLLMIPGLETYWFPGG